MSTVGIHGGGSGGSIDIASLPDEGQQTMANSISVAIASNQSAVPVSGPQTDAEARAYQTASLNFTAGSQSVTLALNGASGASASFVDSSFNGTFKFYVSTDGGTQYIETTGFNIYYATGGAAEISNARHGAISGFRIWDIVLPGGATHVRVTSASGSSGSCVVTLKAGNASNAIAYAIGVPDSDGGTPTGALLVMGRDGTGGTVRSIRVSVNRYERQSVPGLLVITHPATNNVATITKTADTATATQLAAQNVHRYKAIVTNTSSAVLYVLLENSGTAAVTRFTKRLQQWESWEVPDAWIGEIKGVWATDPGDGEAIVTEF